MKLSTKIILGYALLILLMVTALIYQLALMHQMQAINRNLSAMKTRERDYSLRVRDLGQVEDFMGRLYVLKDPEYSSQVKSLIDSITGDLNQDLERLQDDKANREERKELERFASLWDNFAKSASEQEANFPVLPQEDFDKWLGTHVKSLLTQMGRVQAANRAAVDAEV